MTVENWQKIREVLDEALEQPAERRAAFVDDACSEETLRRQVHSILAAYDDETSLLDRHRPEHGFGSTLAGPSPPSAAPVAGRQVGAWTLVERLGEGGMGTVFLARRSDDAYAKQVAVKLLKRSWAGADEIRRFRRERQILADLEHPNIAQLLDGGNTEEGQPFLVMEYVEGQPIDVHCDRRKLGLEDRLRLFLEVCSAVQFAHQNLIVHRDLKPSNILVDTDGRPRLLDFGIAKILVPDHFAETVLPTRTGLTPMTPEYASPEQVRGAPITTASDVYSLGVILYKLLTGASPYRFDGRDLTAVVHAVCHQEVASPSSRVRRVVAEASGAAGPPGDPLRLGRRLRGDLDAIVLRSLAKEPEHRYATAEQLADDLHRHLARQPVRARRQTAMYRAGKFLHRHRAGIAATLVVFFVLLASIATLLVQQERLTAERNRALFERNRAETVSRWLIELFGLPDPSRSLGEQVTARELLDKSRDSIGHDLAADPELSAELLATLGETYANLGLLPEARQSLEAALALERGGSTANDDIRLAGLLFRLADVLQLEGRYLEARRVALEARARAPSGSDVEASSLALLGQVAGLLGETESGREHFAEARALARDLEPETRAFVLEHAAEFHQSVGDTNRARELYEKALALRRELHGDRHPKVALLESSLASPALDSEQEARLRESIESQRALYPEGHPALATSLNNLGLLLVEQSRFEEAREYFEESLAMKRRAYGAPHPKIGATLTNLGQLAARTGDLEEAEARYREAIDLYTRELGEDHPDRAVPIAGLGEIALARGDLESAREHLDLALTVVENALGLDQPRLVPILNNRGEVARKADELEAARRFFSRAVDIAEREGHPDLDVSLYNLAIVELLLQSLDSALENLEAVIDRAGDDSPLGRYASTYLAHALVDAGRPGDAAAWAKRAIDAWERAGEGDGPWADSARQALAEAEALRASGGTIEP